MDLINNVCFMVFMICFTDYISQSVYAIYVRLWSLFYSSLILWHASLTIYLFTCIWVRVMVLVTVSHMDKNILILGIHIYLDKKNSFNIPFTFEFDLFNSILVMTSLCTNMGSVHSNWFTLACNHPSRSILYGSLI